MFNIYHILLYINDSTVLTNKCYLLYKHQWNTRWAFGGEHDIFTGENKYYFTCKNNMKITFYFQKRAATRRPPLLWLHNPLKKYLEVLLYDWKIIDSSGYEISLQVQVDISHVSTANEWDIKLNTQREIPYPRTPIYYPLFLYHFYVMRPLVFWLSTIICLL